MQAVRIEYREQDGEAYWQVTLGRRALRFHDEAAARGFAAQLHMRLDWLKAQAALHESDEESQPS
ncbi:hypothetical protein [Pseudomonas mangiferae]|uniref:Uncharacterized protein n=1 Tax=Pseudomonas mangiferae TaxID=2593654 RepID=A0A553GVI9_9PSED|nr:hypothetical protein [Pseudomonas mangiferae]TRX73507.1 hypothetical protein FM069_17260 [Pseudomonas mangiferae]